MTTTEFDRWLRLAVPGDRVVYHTGLLMKDRLEDEELDLLAVRVWWEGRRGGLVELVQRRIGAGQCEYVAVKRGSGGRTTWGL